MPRSKRTKKANRHLADSSAIKIGEADESANEKPKKPFKVVPGHDTKPKPGLNFDNVWALLSEIEGQDRK